MRIKRFLLTIALACLAGSPALAQNQTSLQKDPAYLPIDQVLDFKVVKPNVNINLPRFLLMDAAAEFDGGANDPLAKAGINFKELIGDVKLIRLVVLETTDATRKHVEQAVAELRKRVEASWTPIVSVPEDNVGIYALSDASGERMAGLALLIYDDGEAVIGNIVGRVSIGKILKVAAQKDAIPKDVLKKLGELTGQGGESAARPAAKAESEKPESKKSEEKSGSKAE